MKKNGPLKIIVTTYKCTPCKNFMKFGTPIRSVGDNKEIKITRFCDHKLFREKNIPIKDRVIGNDLITPDLCPVLQQRRSQCH